MDDFVGCVFEFIFNMAGKLTAVRVKKVFLSIFSSKLGSYSLKKNHDSCLIYRFNF